LLIALGLEDSTHQPIDNAADHVTFLHGSGCVDRGVPIQKWIYGFFALRTVGQMLFFITNKEAVFFATG